MLSAEREAFCSKAIEDGFFAVFKISSWGGVLSHSVKGGESESASLDMDLVSSSDAVFFRKKIKAKELKWSKAVKGRIDRFLADWTYETKYGVFIPGNNAKFIMNKIDEFKVEFMKGKDQVVNGFEGIIKAAERDFRLFAVQDWKRRGFDGAPTKNFVDAYVETQMEKLYVKRGKIQDFFKFDIYFVNPIVGDMVDKFDGVADVSENDMRVKRALFDAILRRRLGLYYLIGNKKKALLNRCTPKALQTAMKPIACHLNGVFYDDPKLKEAISNFVECFLIADDIEVKKVKIIELMDKIRHVIKNDPLFLVQVEDDGAD